MALPTLPWMYQQLLPQLGGGAPSPSAPSNAAPPQAPQSRLRGFLQNLGPALSQVNIGPPTVSPVPTSGVAEVLKAIAGGAQSFQGARQAAQDQQLQNLFQRVRFGPAAQSAMRKVAAGDPNLSPGEEAALNFIQPNLSGQIPDVSRPGRQAAFDRQTGGVLTAGQQQQGQQFTAQQGQQESQFARDLAQRQAQYEKSYDLERRNLDERSKILGFEQSRINTMNSELALRRLQTRAEIRDKYAPDTPEQRAGLNQYLDWYFGDQSKPLDPSIQKIVDTIPTSKELTAEAALRRAQGKEGEFITLMKGLVAQKVQAKDWEDAVQNNKVPPAIAMAMGTLVAPGVGQRITSGDRDTEAAMTALRQWLGVDTSHFFGMFNTPFGAAGASAPQEVPTAPGGPLGRQEGPLGTDPQAELDALKAKHDRGELLTPVEQQRVIELRKIPGVH